MVRGLAPDLRHHVHLYEDAGGLAEHVSVFLGDALRDGGCAVAIARSVTLAMIELQLRNVVDVTALRACGKLELIDADEMLQLLLVDGAPDRERFRQHIEALVRQLRDTAGTQAVHAYGEMVDILWLRGERAAVVALEKLWSELLDEYRFTLLCGYHIRGFDQDATALNDISRHHDAAVTYGTVERGIVTASRVLAQLDQRARALEAEVLRRSLLERRMLELLDLSGQLAGAKDSEQVAKLTIARGVQALGAIEGAFWTLDPDGQNLQLQAASDPMGPVSRYRVVSLAGDTPLAAAMERGEALFIGNLDEYARRFPASWQALKAVISPAQRAFAVLPVIADDRPLAALAFAYDHERDFSGPDRAFKAIVARQCALALRRVQQQEQERALREAAEFAAAAEKAARAEVELLYALTASVNQLDELDDVYQFTLGTVRQGSQCDRAAVLLFDGDGVMRFKASVGLSETYQRAVEGHSPWKQDDAEPKPIVVDDTETDPAWAAYRDVFRAEGIRSLAFVPLVHHRRLLGKFMLYRNEPQPFGARELKFASTVAVHVAQAVERKRNAVELARAYQDLARTYREERDAHLQAEEATRAREEILSVVSHDLRNPLGTILMGATTLLAVDVGGKGHRIRTVAERIHRQAERMARLIEDLVDFAGIQAGKLAITRKANKPEDIISATSDIFGPLAQERGLRFETRVIPNLPAVECDPDRAVQVMSNLVANALKVTPRGGAISIGVEPKDNEIVFFVRDTGPGIDEDELPQLFERYWRSKQSQYKGAGLGLSIARGIVDAHGGRIWAESRIGAGSTFYFSLASLRNN